MANTITRRPLPALVSLLALLALTGIVWWRVLNRDTGDSGGAKATKSSTPCTSSSPAPPVRTLPGPSAVTVAVLNSTTRVGIATKARDTLLADGFRIPAKATDDTGKTVPDAAQIRYGTNGADGARLLHYYFPGATLKKVKGSSHTVIVSLGTKYQSVESPAKVRAALDHDRVALAPATGSTTPKPTAGAKPSGSATPAC